MKFDNSDPATFTRSISEFNRQMEELALSKNPEPYGIKTYHQACERIRDLRETVNDPSISKGIRRGYFTELRRLEEFWGIESVPYNGGFK